MKDGTIQAIRIYDSSKIATAVYKNAFTSMFPIVITSFGSGKKIEQRLMNAKEQKMIIVLIACAKANGGREVRLPLDVFKTLTGDKSHYSRAEYEQYLFFTMKTLQTGFCTYDENSKMMLPLFSRASGIDSSTHEIVFSISDEFVGLFNDIDRNFTVVQLAEILPLIGRYSIVLYRLLIQWDSVGQISIPMSDLAQQMFLSPSYRENTGNITKKIIRPSISELQKKVERFAGLDFRYDHKYKPDAANFFWSKQSERLARQSKKDNDVVKKLENSIHEILIESNSVQCQYSMPGIETQGSRNLQSEPVQNAIEKSDPLPNWKTYIPTEEEVRQYARQQGLDPFTKAKIFVVYCQSKLFKYKTWESAGCFHGWKDYFSIFIAREDSFSRKEQPSQKVDLPDYMSRPLPESRQPSEELLDKIRKMQNDFRK